MVSNGISSKAGVAASPAFPCAQAERESSKLIALPSASCLSSPKSLKSSSLPLSLFLPFLIKSLVVRLCAPAVLSVLVR